jgi:hypothetical protein
MIELLITRPCLFGAILAFCSAVIGITVSSVIAVLNRRDGYYSEAVHFSIGLFSTVSLEAIMVILVYILGGD